MLVLFEKSKYARIKNIEANIGMKKIDFKEKRVVISLVIIVMILVVALLFGYRYYQQQALQKKIDVAITQIEEIEKDFNVKDNKEEKISILKSILKEHKDYENSKDNVDEIDKKYHSAIANMQKSVKSEYDKIISENTLKDLDKVSDKEQLYNAKAKLSEVLQTIQNEKEVVCTENEVKEYEKEITSLIKSYEDKLTKIKEAEKKQQQSNSNSYGNENSSSNGSSNNQNNSNYDDSGKDLPGYSTHRWMSWETSHFWFTDDDSEGGIKYVDIVTWENGDTYDLITGEYICNKYTDAW